jgi:hypothetical protein
MKSTLLRERLMGIGVLTADEASGAELVSADLIGRWQGAAGYGLAQGSWHSHSRWNGARTTWEWRVRCPRCLDGA